MQKRIGRRERVAGKRLRRGRVTFFDAVKSAWVTLKLGRKHSMRNFRNWSSKSVGV